VALGVVLSAGVVVALRPAAAQPLPVTRPPLREGQLGATVAAPVSAVAANAN